MNLQPDEILSATINQQPHVYPLKEISDKQKSLYNDSGNQDHSRAELRENTIQSHIQPADTKKQLQILIIALTLLLILSVILNIYFGIKSQGKDPAQELIVSKQQLKWDSNCSDYSYQIIIPTLSSKRVVMNVTHWPQCYYLKFGNVPKTGLSSVQSIQNPGISESDKNTVKVSAQQNQVSPLVGNTQATNMRIWNDVHKISIIAQIY